MAISPEHLKLTLSTEGASKAQQEIADLDAETRVLTQDSKKLTDEIQRLRTEQSKLREEGKKNTVGYRENAKAITDNKIALDKNTQSVNDNKTKSAELRKELGLAGMSYRQLTKEKQRLTDLRDNTVHGTQQWKDYNTQLGAVNARMGEVSGKAQQTSMSMGKLADGFNRYSAIALSVVAVITGITMSLQSLITGNAKLSDTMADVSKTTNLTAEEVRQLNTAFRNIDTRTAQADLLALATAAGKLGIRGKDNIEGFVRSADKLQVALGGDLGGDAEETAKKVGKLVDVFKMKDTYDLADAMERTGSVINELGSNSSASESYIVDFTTRLAGIAPNAKIAYTEVAGLAATLDSLGQTEEMAATAAGTLIMDMFKNTAEYANTAGMSVKDFSTLLNTDANSAMIAVLENIKGNNDGMAEMALRMQDLGIDGARATSVIGVLANNTETLRQQQALANQAFEQNISLQAEFDKKNNNFAATLDKIGKRMASAFISPAIVQGLEDITTAFYDLIKITEQSKIEQERDKVLALAGALTDSTLKLEDRKKILVELQGIAPEVAANLDAESINYKTLADNVNKYNENVVKRIQLENLKDSQKDALQDYAELQMERAKLVADANKTMMRDFSDIASREGTVQERLKATLAYIEEMKRKYAETSDMSKGFGGGKSVEEMREIQRITSKTLELSVQLSAINNKESQIAQAETIKNQSEQYVEELKKILGLSTEIKQVQTGTKLPDAGAPTNPVAPVSKADRKEADDRAAAEKKMAEESIKRYRELLRQRELDNMNALDKEIGLINDKYDAEISAYQFSAAQIDDLNNARQAEIDQARVRNREVVMQEELAVLQRAYDEEMLMNDQVHFEMTQELINSKQATAEELLASDQRYADESYAVELAMLEKRKRILAEYGKNTTDVDRQILELHKKNLNQKDILAEESLEREKARAQQQLDMTLALSTEIGAEFGRLIASGERDLEQYTKALIKTLLRSVKTTMQAAIAQSTALALAQADSVATFGVSGFARAAAMTVLIEGAFTAFEASIDQFATGRYDVIGAQDGKSYNVPYTPRLSTGVVNSPVLVGELPEVVWDTKTTRNIMLNAPWLIDEMNRYRVPQRATGEYSSMPATAGSSAPSASNDQLMQMIAANMAVSEKLIAKLDELGASSIRAHVVLDDLQSQQKYYNDVNNRISLRS